MMWFFLALLTALAVATQDTWVKKYFSHLGVYEMSVYPLFYSLPLFAVSIPFVHVPELGPDFYWSFIIGVPLNAIAFFLYIKAIQISPLSLTIPYLALTPVFMIVTGKLFLGETPALWGIAGIVLTVTGSYILNVDPKNRGIFAPVRAVFRETGSWIMLIVAFIFSFTAVIGKVTIINSSPMFFSMVFYAVFDLTFILFLVCIGKVDLRIILNDKTKGLVAGGLFYVQVLLHGFAISLTKAAYMISVKRLNVVFSIFYGVLIFKEKNIRIRLCGALIMLGGAVLILLSPNF